MREIKFRAWFPQIPSMIEFKLGENNLSCIYNGERYTNWDIEDARDIMQFTGLKDKNGKDVYESDLVVTGSGRICEVEWHIGPTLCGWDLLAKNMLSCPPPSIGIWDNIEVIGNIYEHSNLLK